MPLNAQHLNVMNIQKILQNIKNADLFDLIKFYHEIEQKAQASKEPVLWNPAFREQIVSAFAGNAEISAKVEKLYLEILSELYDAQESVRSIIRKAVSDLLDEASSQLGI